jgi:hypothetical protein
LAIFDQAGSRTIEQPGGSDHPPATSCGGPGEQNEQNKLPARRRRRLGAEIGTSITDLDGYLLRERPGSDVAVGPVAAALLSKGFPARDIALLKAIEQLGVMTSEQLARAFFNSPRSAYNRLLLLAERRFLVRLGVDAATIRTAVGYGGSDQVAGSALPRKNPAYALDWNGYYLLSAHHNYPVSNWRPSTAAVITSRFGHTLGISEIWSYLVAAARATHDLDHSASDPWRYRLSVGHLDEGQALLTTARASGLAFVSAAAASTPTATAFGVTGTFSDAHDPGRSASAKAGKVLLQPDAVLTVAIRQLAPAQGGGEGTPFRNGGPDLPVPFNPRWNPTLASWEPALLQGIASPIITNAGEKPGAHIYRSLLLEMETGSNNRNDSISKVEAYNKLIRSNERAWHGAYGIAPRVLVVVRTDNQLAPMADLWRAAYAIRGETSVLLASLQTLARTYGAGRRALIDEPCWYDVMAVPQPTWKTLGEAMRISSALARVRK